MFEKFGEFDSAEELNRAARGFWEEGDTESLKAMAAENGIDQEDVTDYLDGCTKELATVSMAAFGRLLAEEQQEELPEEEKMVGKVLFEMTRSLCLQEEFNHAVMKKGKRVLDIYRGMREEAGRHQSKRENGHTTAVSCGSDRQLCHLIAVYYTKNAEEFKKALKALYE